MIRVRYFATLREQLGVDAEVIADDAIETLADLIQLLYSRGGLWPHVLGAPNVHIVRNHAQVHSHSEPLDSGDEIAFLPPVTGG